MNTVYQSIREFEWQIVPLPRGPAGRFNRMAGAGLGVGTQTKYVDESWEFVNRTLAGVPEDEKKQLLYGNAMRVYGL